MAAVSEAGGKVYLIGAGPGDPGLFTLKGKRCLEEAEELREEARAFGYDDTGDVVANLCANDARRPAPRRWWWTVLRRA